MSLNYKKLITGIVDQQLQPAGIHNEKWKKIAQVIQSSRYLQVNGTIKVPLQK